MRPVRRDNELAFERGQDMAYVAVTMRGRRHTLVASYSQLYRDRTIATTWQYVTLRQRALSTRSEILRTSGEDGIYQYDIIFGSYAAIQ